jgi:hypothetical protein
MIQSNKKLPIKEVLCRNSKLLEGSKISSLAFDLVHFSAFRYAPIVLG